MNFAFLNDAAPRFDVQFPDTSVPVLAIQNTTLSANTQPHGLRSSSDSLSSMYIHATSRSTVSPQTTSVDEQPHPLPSATPCAKGHPSHFNRCIPISSRRASGQLQCVSDELALIPPGACETEGPDVSAMTAGRIRLVALESEANIPRFPLNTTWGPPRDEDLRGALYVSTDQSFRPEKRRAAVAELWHCQTHISLSFKSHPKRPHLSSVHGRSPPSGHLRGSGGSRRRLQDELHHCM
ncbi:hypothetical protein BD311DRAFT_747090 [Dichomitus squalens]|uniref:Uncharacterized protein n=1 Tax=Dichomitus squalens TaxID=114155 RepID=A0A4V2K1U4_9APHY|nr:hypothetical protein BD311DRAFT_747090 [Dichomitus squalens]